MRSKILLAAVALLAVLGVGVYVIGTSQTDTLPLSASSPVTNTIPPIETKTRETATPPAPETSSTTASPSVKEFTMTAYYDDKGVWYSLKEMSVHKGDTVRIAITNTKGMHDFTIDELHLHEELPLNKEVVVEFTADKAGDFVYYCSKPNHRARGQWGTLHVTE